MLPALSRPSSPHSDQRRPSLQASPCRAVLYTVTLIVDGVAEAGRSAGYWVGDRSRGIRHGSVPGGIVTVGRHSVPAVVPRHAAPPGLPGRKLDQSLSLRLVVRVVAAAVVLVLVSLSALYLVSHGQRAAVDNETAGPPAASGQPVTPPLSETQSEGASDSPGSSPTDSAAPSGPRAGQTSAAPTSNPSDFATVLVQTSAAGDGSLPPFTAPGAWQVHYSFDCGRIGRPDTFTVTTSGRAIVQASGYIGADVVTMTEPGRQALKVVTPCSWDIRVLGHST